MPVRSLHSMPCTHQAAGPACAWTNAAIRHPLPLVVTVNNHVVVID